jgi:hypothetical protein
VAINEHMHPYGTKLSYSTNGTTYTEVDDLIDVDCPEPTFGKSDDTTLTSPDFLKVFSPGWLEQGDADFTVYTHKTQLGVLNTFFYNRQLLFWRVECPRLTTEPSAGTKFEFKGYLLKVKAYDKLEVGSEDKYRTVCTITATTKVTITAGATVLGASGADELQGQDLSRQGPGRPWHREEAS